MKSTVDGLFSILQNYNKIQTPIQKSIWFDKMNVCDYIWEEIIFWNQAKNSIIILMFADTMESEQNLNSRIYILLEINQKMVYFCYISELFSWIRDGYELFTLFFFCNVILVKNWYWLNWQFLIWWMSLLRARVRTGARDSTTV